MNTQIVSAANDWKSPGLSSGCFMANLDLRTAKATDPKELLMVLAPSVGSNKGHYEEYESFESYSEKGKHKMKRDNLRDNSRDN